MSNELLAIHEIWVYLSASPLFALLITLGAYLLGLAAYEKSQRNPLANPVLISVVCVSLLLWLVDMPYAKYFEGAQFVHFLLGTATVALAIPIYKGWTTLKGRLLILMLSLVAGGATSIGVAVGLMHAFDADVSLTLGMYAKSVTAPIAMGVAERIGAPATLTAVYAVTTGILGAILGRYVLNLMGVHAWWQRGFALGVAAHGIGTSRAFSVHPQAGVYASLAMGMHGIVGAVLIPMIVF
jgi:putative effector of murein hydrolase